MEKKFAWTDFYMELANALLRYESDRTTLIPELQDIFARAKIKFPFREKGIDIDEDICPFTVFGSFNKGITHANRTALLVQFKQKMDIRAEVPANFDGIPVVMPFNAWFFANKENRGEQDIDNLWELFKAAILLADHPSESNRNDFIRLYDIVMKQKNVKWNLTMGLYWIRPFTFINLDETNRNFIMNTDHVPPSFTAIFSDVTKGVPDGAGYLSMCEQARDTLNNAGYPYRNFPQLSYCAWQNANQHKDPVGGSDSPSIPPSIDSNVKETAFWLYSPGTNAYMWDEFYQNGMMGVGWEEIGCSLKEFSSKEKLKEKMKSVYGADLTFKNDAHCLWQFANEMNAGDIVIAKKGMRKIVGKGIVTSDYIYDTSRSSFLNVRKVDWQAKGEWAAPKQLSMKTLTNISPYPDLVAQLLSLFEEETPEEIPAQREIKYPVYTKDDLLSEVFMSEEQYRTLAGLLNTGSNIILQGAPGVGKTYAAKRLAYSIMGMKDTGRVAMVQFHQSYSYEDFIQGYRPSDNGFRLENGIFYTFCKDAEEDDERPYFFIIGFPIKSSYRSSR